MGLQACLIPSHQLALCKLHPCRSFSHLVRGAWRGFRVLIALNGGRDGGDIHRVCLSHPLFRNGWRYCTALNFNQLINNCWHLNGVASDSTETIQWPLILGRCCVGDRPLLTIEQRRHGACLPRPVRKSRGLRFTHFFSPRTTVRSAFYRSASPQSAVRVLPTPQDVLHFFTVLA